MSTPLSERTDAAHLHMSDKTSVDSSAELRRARPNGKLLLIVLVVLGIGLAILLTWSLWSDSYASDNALIFYTVKRGDLPIDVTESGSLQSQNTTEIRCEVENIGAERTGTQILSIVENGKNVEKDELLVVLDSAIIQERLDEQELATERARSDQVQKTAKWENQQTQNETTLAEAELKVQLAELALQQYEDEEGGTFQIELQNIDQQIQTAEATRLIKATDLKGIEMLRKLGYRSRGDLEQARLAALSADGSVARAIASRKELTEYTYRKTKMQLEGSLASAKRAVEQVKRDNQALLVQAEAAKTAADRALQKEEEKLAKYKEQFEKCEIRAPHGGMVTYASSDITEGLQVHQRQEIITLPDLSVMEVKTSVHESVLQMVQRGLKATITVDAVPDRSYKGSVKSVAVLAERGHRFSSSDVKKYTTIVTIDEPVSRLRPGMSATAVIHVDRLENIISIPVQAIIQRGKSNWCYVETDGSIELRSITLGKTNDIFVEISEGLEEGERVILNPMSLIEEDSDKKEIGPQESTDENGVDPNAGMSANDDSDDATRTPRNQSMPSPSDADRRPMGARPQSGQRPPMGGGSQYGGQRPSVGGGGSPYGGGRPSTGGGGSSYGGGRPSMGGGRRPPADSER